MLILVPCIGNIYAHNLYVHVYASSDPKKILTHTVETQHFTMSLPFKFWRSKAELFTPFFNFSNSAWYRFYEWRKQRSFGKEEVNSTSNLAPVIYTYMLKLKKNLCLMVFKNNYIHNTNILCKGRFFAQQGNVTVCLDLENSSMSQQVLFTKNHDYTWI